MLIKPMLAGKVDLEKLKFPVMVSPKLDGIRAIVVDGQLVSRTLKPIPNHHIRNTLSKPEFEGLDGELIVGIPTAKDCFNQSTSAVMRQLGEPDFKFHVFDNHISKDEPFMTRHELLCDRTLPDPCKIVVHRWIYNHEELLSCEKGYIEQGFEGLMIRDPMGRYKYGRSTTNEGLLLKLKRFSDAEAVIIGLEELYSNQNEAQTNELGRTKRSTHQENLVPMGVLGAFKVRDLFSGAEFSIGTGFSQAQREEYWSAGNLVGKTVKYKYFEIGVKIAPRHPVFLGFRDVLIDL